MAAMYVRAQESYDRKLNTQRSVHHGRSDEGLNLANVFVGDRDRDAFTRTIG